MSIGSRSWHVNAVAARQFRAEIVKHTRGRGHELSTRRTLSKFSRIFSFLHAQCHPSSSLYGFAA